MAPVWKKFEAIESLRGWMAWWVVIGHAQVLTGGTEWGALSPVAYLASRGDLGVQVFMIVSGFVIAHLLTVKQESYGEYILRRWFRLMPLFVAVLILAVVTRGLYEVAFTHNPWAGNPAMRLNRMDLEASNWPTYLLLHLSLLHGLLPDTLLKYSSSAFLAPAWSLSLEWQFYLIAPFLIAGMRHLKFAWGPCIAIAVSIIAGVGLLGTWEYPSFLLLALPFFLIGITSRLLLDKKFPLLAVVITVAAAVAYAYGHGAKQALYDAVIVAPIWGAFLLITAREVGVLPFRSEVVDRLSWIIALNPVSVALGRVSYSTYLSHIPVLSIVIGSGMIITHANDRTTVGLLTVLGLIVSAAFSFFTYRYIERPGIALGARWVKRRPIDDEAAA